MYKASLSYVDEMLGTFFGELKRTRLWDDTLLVVTADHGENLCEHGVYCDHPLIFDETIHVPLWIKFPGNVEAGKECEFPVGHEDLVPTILALAGAREEIWPGRGRNLLEILSRENPGEGRVILSFHNKMFQGSVRTGQYVWIENLDLQGVRPHMIHLYKDTGLFDAHGQKITDSALEEKLHEELRGFLNRCANRFSPRDLKDEHIRSRLKDLGYIE